MLSKTRAIYLSMGLGVMGVICLFISLYYWENEGISNTVCTLAVACLAASPILLLVYKFGDRRWWPGAIFATAILVAWFVAVVFVIWSPPSRILDKVFDSTFIVTGFALLMVPALNIRKDKGALLPSVLGVLGCLLTCALYLVSISTWELYTYELLAATLLSYGAMGVFCLYWLKTERNSFTGLAILGAGVSLVGMGISAYFSWWREETRMAPSIIAAGFLLLIALGIVRVNWNIVKGRTP